MRGLIASIGFLLSFSPVSAEPVDLEKGQIWTFKNAPTQEARIIIGDIEPLWDGREVAVSISIIGLEGVRLSNGKMVGDEIAHLPMAYDGLEADLVELTDQALKMPKNYAEGYSMWRTAVEAGEAGVFNVSPAAAIDIVYVVMLGAK